MRDHLQRSTVTIERVDCLDETTVTLFLDRRLPVDQVSVVESHIDGCDSCRRVLSELARGRSNPGEPVVREAGGPLGELVARYVLRERIGSGGMGTVYAAYDPVLDRRVAVKLLHRDVTGGAEGRLRVMREAQAMARVASPNVVAIYDVGTFEDQIYISMELVEGVTLKDWLRERPRGWREIARVFAAAGRGLVAAHDKGMLHRDFKPENVLLDGDHVRVADFGLAAPIGDLEHHGDPTNAPLDQPLTLTGAIVGTPAYMAPERLAGQRIDARSDQFSFCVALYEALYGMRPFQGDSLDELSREVRAGRVRPPARRGPAWLRAAVMRGLALDPAERHPAMAALVRKLEAPRRGWRIAFVATAALATVAVALALVARQPAPSICRGAPDELAAVWNEPRRVVARNAFARTGQPFAAAVWASVDPLVDRYARDWVAMRTDACEATRIRGNQSDEHLGLRMACLDRSLQALDGLVRVLGDADRAVVTRARAAAESLPPITICADVEALSHRARAPVDPVTTARVAVLASQLAYLEAERDAGRYPNTLARARQAVAEARTIGWRPTEARALVLEGDLEDKTGAAPAAAATLRAAALAAVAGRDDQLAADAWTELVFVTGYELDDTAVADDAAKQAAAAVERLGNAPELAATLASHRGAVAARRGAFEEARASFEEALGDAERAGAKELAIAGLLNNLGSALVSLGRNAEAAEKLRRALAIRERLLGPDHPDVATTLTNLANALDAAGDSRHAVALYRRALALHEKLLGPDHPKLARTLIDAAMALGSIGERTEALAMLQRALAIHEHAFGPDSAQVGDTLVEVGGMLQEMQRFDEALVVERRAVAIAIHSHGEQHPSVAHALNDLGLVLNAKGANADALATYKRALAIATRTLGPKHPRLAYSLSGVGDSYAGLGDERHAIEAYEAAVALLASSEEDPGAIGAVMFHLAKLLWHAGGHDRARELAARADEQLTKAGAGAASEVEAWLAAHPKS